MSEQSVARVTDPLGRRIFRAAIGVALILFLPSAVGALALGWRGAVAALLGALFTVVVVGASGWTRALRSLPLLVLSAAAGALWAGTAGWVLLLAALGVAAGLASRWGRVSTFAVAGMLGAAASILDKDSGLLPALTVLALAGLYVVVLMRRVGVPAIVQSPRAPTPLAVAAGGLLGLVVLVTSVIALQWDESHAYYFPIFAFLLAMPSPGVARSKQARDRLLGAAVALVGSLPLIVVAPAVELRLGLVLVLIIASLVVDEPMWVRQALSTLAIILALGPEAGGIAAGETRLAALATAAALVLAAGTLLAWWAGRRTDWIRPEDWIDPAV